MVRALVHSLPARMLDDANKALLFAVDKNYKIINDVEHDICSTTRVETGEHFKATY